MNRDEILNMPAGREMDALIKRHVMGGLPPIFHHINIPLYSIDMSAAWKVVEKMKDTFSEICIDADKDWRCYFDNACASAETAPLAICRAALIAIVEEK